MVEIGSLPFGMALMADRENRTSWIRVGRSTFIRPWELKHMVGAQSVRDAITRLAKVEEDRCRKQGVPILSDLNCAAALHASIHMNPENAIGGRRYAVEVATA